jgi:hypothetical protein
VVTAPTDERSYARGVAWFLAATAAGLVLAVRWPELLLVLIVARGLFELWRAKTHHPGWLGALRALGLTLLWGVGMLLAVLLISGPLIRAYTGLEDLDRRLKNQAPIAYGAGLPDGADDRALASRYEPLLVFSKGERWHPVTVDRFVHDAQLRAAHGERILDHATIAYIRRLTRCRQVTGEFCYRLVLPDCNSPAAACAQDMPGDQPAVYYRVVRAGPKHPELDRATPVGRVDLVLQYWYFYRYDEWRGRGGKFAQLHQGDWEAMTLGFRDGTPLFAGYSQHCGGAWKRWSKTIGGIPAQLDDRTREERAAWRVTPRRLAPLQAGVVHGSHPIAYVARGSHALYPDPLTRVPNWAECKDLTIAAALLGPSYSAGAREGMSFRGPRRKPLDADARAQLAPLISTDGAGFMRYRGLWGGGDRTTLFGHLAAEGPGPETPAFKALWRDPLRVVFCSRYWTPVQHCRT